MSDALKVTEVHSTEDLSAELGPLWKSFYHRVIEPMDAAATRPELDIYSDELQAAWMDALDFCPTWRQWFDGVGRWARVLQGTDEDGQTSTSVSVYEGTGQYCDQFYLVPPDGWTSAESGPCGVDP